MLEMRTSERGSLKRCPQQWHWAQVDGLRPNRESNPLWFGSLVHIALADWYLPGLKRGPHPAETFLENLDGERLMLVTNEDDEQEYLNAKELGVSMLTRYIETYGNDESWEVIATEQKGSIVLDRPEMKIFGRTRPHLPRWMRYHFTWDGVYRDLEDGQIKLMEHKTTAAITTLHLTLDDQAGSYWAIASSTLVKMGVLKPQDEIVGITYNFLRKALDDLRPKNADGYRTNKPTKNDFIDALDPVVELNGKEALGWLEATADKMGIRVLGEQSKTQPPLFFERHDVYRTRGERETQIQRIKDEALFIEAYRKKFLPITKSPDRQHCNWCTYKRMCELDEQGDQEAVEDFKATMYHVEDPYLVYKKSTE